MTGDGIWEEYQILRLRTGGIPMNGCTDCLKKIGPGWEGQMTG